MKNITLFIFLLSSLAAISQNISMQNGTFNQCSGIFYDSGGSSSNYSSNESFVITICPENSGQLAQLDFTAFSTQLNADIMTIYNGDSTAANVFGTFSGGASASPGFVQATQDNNASGCLTIEFVSDGTGAGTGWAATISCLTPCQTINSVLNSSSPTTNGDGYIRVCVDDPITLNGSGTFSVDGAGATYEWDLGDGNTISGQSATFSYPNPGVYIVNLNITDTNPRGCSNTNLINQVIQVGTEADFSGTQASKSTICFGESTTITGVVAPVEFINDCTPPVSGTTYLPDGSGAVYSTCITVDCFESNQTLTNPNQLTNICLNMEHSFLGDLQITIISPNGQQAILKAYPGGGGTYLGGANDDGSNTPGTGADYCFSMTGTQLLVNGPTQTAGSNPPGNSIVPGTYLPVQSFNSLVGSPLNGNWCIRVVDNLAVDNGYIFSWGLDFDPNIQPPELSFTPVITAESWDTDSTITNTTGNTITVAPASAGQYCYTYRAMDDFGCEYTEEVCIDVLPEIIHAAPNNLFLCNPGAPPYLFDLTENTPIVLAPSPAPADFVVTFHETQADAENDTAIIGNANAYPGSDSQIIYVRIEYQTSGCYEIETFTLNITSQPTINSVGDLILCDDVSNDGVAAFNLTSQTLGILGPQPASDFTVTYYTSFANADTNTGALTSPYTNTSNPQPIFVRIERIGDAACNNTSPQPVFNLVLNASDNPAFSITPTCDGATAVVSGTSGGSFTLNPAPTDAAIIDPNNGTVTNATSGTTYTVEYTTNGPCPSTGTQSFTVPTVDNASFTLAPTCDGAITTVTGTTGGVFALNPAPTDGAVVDASTGTVTGGTPGTSYAIEYTTSGTCPSSSTQTFTVIPTDDATFSLTPTCDGATATIAGTSGGTFALNPTTTDGAVINSGTGTITGGASETTYTVEYTTTGTCPATSTQSVTVLTTDDSSFTLDSTCEGGIATITGVTGGTFAFNPSPSDAAIIDATTGTVTGGTPSASYTIQYTTEGVCPSSTTEILNVLPIDNSGFTIAPSCDGGIAAVTGLSGGAFNFNPVPTDAATINASSGLVTNATPGTSYIIEYTTNGACPSTSAVTFTVNPLPTIFAPTNLAVCDDNVGDGFTAIELNVRNTQITGGNGTYVVSYHLTQTDANSGNSPLAEPYTNISNPQTIYVRVIDGTTGCFDTTTLLVQVEQAPGAFIPDALEFCDPNNDGFGEFDLTDAQNQITGGDGTLVVTYHETLANAQNNVNVLPTDYDNIVAFSQTVHARVVSSTLATGCPTIVPLVLNVLSTPVVPLEIADYVSCDEDSDGTVQFDLTTKNGDIVGNQDPSQYLLTYHVSQADADGGTGAIVNVGNYTNISNPQSIFVRLEGANGCYTTGDFQLRVNLPPLTFQPTELGVCDDMVADEMTSFNLTEKDDEITGGDGSLAVSYYTTDADAQSGTNAISPATDYTNITVAGNPANPQTLYVRVTDTATGCTSFRTLTIRVLPNPMPGTNPSDIVLCDDINTGDGQESFDLTENEAYILGGVSGLTATYHASYGDAASNTGAISNPASYTNVGTNNTPQTIYARVTNDTTGCFAIVDFNILVNPLAEVIAVTDYIICDDNDDGVSQFDLNGKDGEVLNGQDALLYDVTYHATLDGAENLTGSLNSPYTNTSNPQQIFVAITNIQTGCSISTVSFMLEVDNGARANIDQEPIEQVQCDYLGDNDGIAQFDLTENNGEVLDGQDPANYIVSYYATSADAELGNNAIPNIYENLSNPQTIYVRVDNDTPDIAGMDSSICYAVAELTLRVDLRPIIELEDSYTLCLNTNGTEVINPPLLDTGLSAIDYTFEWLLDGNLLAGETAPFLAAGQSGNYVVNVTNNTTGCIETDSAMVVDSSPPMITVEVATQAFSENSIIVAMATGEGDYEYSLDNGAWQESGTFTEVSFGEHTVTARDINGCGIASGSVTVMDYPQFFTPNGDGRNETWNIVGFAGQSNAKIYIFDRYGKLLKQISPAGQGWNGTYNGELMPTSDYWFTVEYNEPSTGAQKQFGAHFTLKR